MIHDGQHNDAHNHFWEHYQDDSWKMWVRAGLEMVMIMNEHDHSCDDHDDAHNYFWEVRLETMIIVTMRHGFI